MRLLGLLLVLGCGIYCTLIMLNFDVPKPLHITIGITGAILGVVINLTAVSNKAVENEETDNGI